MLYSWGRDAELLPVGFGPPRIGVIATTLQQNCCPLGLTPVQSACRVHDESGYSGVRMRSASITSCLAVLAMILAVVGCGGGSSSGNSSVSGGSGSTSNEPDRSSHFKQQIEAEGAKHEVQRLSREHGLPESNYTVTITNISCSKRLEGVQEYDCTATENIHDAQDPVHGDVEGSEAVVDAVVRRYVPRQMQHRLVATQVCGSSVGGLWWLTNGRPCGLAFVVA